MNPTAKHRSRIAPLLLAAFLLLGPNALASSGELQVVYLANEGFLLRTPGSSVLIDALFGDGLFGYDALDREERRELERAAYPYDNVALVLASHFHGDHFDAAAVARFLLASPTTRFVSTEQAVAKLLAYDSTLADRAEGLFPAAGQKAHLTVGDADVTVLNLHHGRASDVQNLGLLIEICGVTVLHIGDTEASAEEMRAAGLERIRPDLALLPSWYLRPGHWTEATKEVIRPERIVAMHIPTAEAPPSYFWGDLRDRKALASAVREGFENAFVPLSHGESTSLACRLGD